MPLISPPPHHDIYSIEDLAQLIYDLKQVNPQVRVGVKLVSSIGVGTIAAGVAKAHADYVQISGHDGATGASPMQSIKHTGIPWERGLAEAQQILVRNGLRSRVRLRVDGGLKTGRDIVIAAMLGAEEFGFGTASLVALGCDMARQCHLNTCPTGIATQREDLRAKFTGTPQMLIHYLTLVAEETRELMAQLGVRRLDDLVGRADLLKSNEETTIDLEPILIAAPQRCTETQSLLPQSQISEQLLVESEAALCGEHSVLIQYHISNNDRSIGASLAGEIARRYGNSGLPGVSITCLFQGAAGQSFGAFNMPNRCNTELVEFQRMHDPDEVDALRTIIQWHGKKTRSWRAAQILAEWSRMKRAFWRVLPRDTSELGLATIRTACDYVDVHAYSAELSYI